MVEYTIYAFRETLLNGVWNYLLYYAGFAAFMAVVYFAIIRYCFLRKAQTYQAVVKSGLLGLFGISLVTYFLLAITYSIILATSDHVESGKACVSWYFWEGYPLYQDFNTQERYSSVYGPFPFISIACFEAMLGPSINAAKVPCAMVALAAMVLLFFSIRRNCSLRQAVILTGAAAVIFLFVGRITYGIYTDPFVIFPVCLAVFFAGRNNRLAPLLVGVCLGLAENAKMHGLLYFIPIYGWLLVDRKWKLIDFFVSGICSLIVYALPFLLIGNISFSNYLLIVGTNANTFSLAQFAESSVTGILIFFPFLFWQLIRFVVPGSVKFVGTSEQAKLGVLLVAVGLVMLPASRYGAGGYHLLPLVPSAFVLLSQYRLVSLGNFSFRHVFLSALFLTWISGVGWDGVKQSVQTEQYFESDQRQGYDGYDADLRGIVTGNPGWSILMAGGGDQAYPKTYFRYNLIFAGMPLGIDPVALMDFQLTGHGDVAFTPLMEELQKRYHRPVMWICPKGEQPFSMHNTAFGKIYDVYPESFVKDFSETYKYYGSSQLFDAYVPR